MCIPWCLILDTEGFTAVIMCDYLPYIHMQRETWEKKVLKNVSRSEPRK